MAIALAIVVALPFFINLLLRPAGGTYLGIQFATDDNMVYAAWMKQAMSGHFLFDNRFTTDAQPGLTFHFYFLLLGWVAKILGIAFTLTFARMVFSGLFVWLLYHLIRRTIHDGYTQKLALTLVSLGGGIGFLVWHQFGQAFVRESPLSGPMLGRLPIDVWQTEGFVFPSMLENGLFMASLCLIVGIFVCVLDARESWRPVPFGALAFLTLMNIHSYDVLLVALVLIGFLVTALVNRTATGLWIARVVVMALGVVPAALWFVHVLHEDTVFQARAATETYTSNFRQILVGYVLLIGLGLYGAWKGRTLLGEAATPRRSVIGISVLGLLLVELFVLAGDHLKGYWMLIPMWSTFIAVMIGLAVALRTDDDGPNLILSWALVGLAAPYFPALFQRKLMMGLSVPWALLAAVGLSSILGARERGMRNLVAICGLALLCGTSLQWFFRDISLARMNVSNTTVHPVYLSADATEIVAKLDAVAGDRTVVLAMPGAAAPLGPDSFATPYLPDLNPIVSGLAGVYTYAGHWSETPDYNRRRTEASMFFVRMSDEDRHAFLADKKINYVIAPAPSAFPQIPELTDLKSLGEVVFTGPQFALIKITPRS